MGISHYQKKSLRACGVPFEHVQSYPSTVYDFLFNQAQENEFEFETTTTHIHIVARAYPTFCHHRNNNEHCTDY